MRAWKWALPASTLAVLLVQFVIQPAALYPGDAVAIRMEASYLVSHGSLGIPLQSREAAAIAPELIPPRAHEDQYFWLNHTRDAYFARWGIGNTVTFAIPLLFSNPTPMGAPLLVLNLFNALLAALLVAGILFACARGGVRPGAAVPIAIAWLYSSYLLYYARVQSAEIVQCALIVWAFAAFREANVRFETNRPAWVAIAAMNVLLAVLTLAKIQFVVAWVLAVACLLGRRSLRERRVSAGVAISAAVLLAAGAIQLGVDTWKFGSPFEIGKLGYPFPHLTKGWGFSVKEYASSLPDFLWGARGSIVRYAPLFVLALLGGVAHARRARREAAFVWGAFVSNVLIAGATINHNGEWCIGPRYLIQVVALVAPLAAEAFASWTDAKRPVRARVLAWTAFVVLTLIGVRDETYACLFHPFASHRVDSMLHAGPLPPGGAEYLDHASRIEVLKDLHAFCEEESNPVTSIFAYQMPRIGPENSTRALKELQAYCQPNLALFRHLTF